MVPDQVGGNLVEQPRAVWVSRPGRWSSTLAAMALDDRAGL